MKTKNITLSFLIGFGLCGSGCTDGFFIQRMTYPQGEKLINEANYNAGVAQLEGGDKTSSPLWWASKKSNYCTSAN